MDFERIKRTHKNFGIPAVCFDFVYRALSQMTYFKILVGMTLELKDVAPKFLDMPAKYSGKILTHEELEHFSKDPENDLPSAFIEYALSKEDECYAILDGERLAAYGWYSNKPTRLSYDLDLHFDNSYRYMYRGWTVKAYRGQRLHAIGMANALKHYHNQGYRGLISYVEANNFSSLRSVYRMGYKSFGKVYILRVLDKYLIHYNKPCEQYNFYVAPKKKSDWRNFGPAVMKP